MLILTLLFMFLRWDQLYQMKWILLADYILKKLGQAHFTRSFLIIATDFKNLFLTIFLTFLSSF